MTKIESVDQNVRWDPHVLSCRPPHAKVKGRKKVMVPVMMMKIIIITMMTMAMMKNRSKETRVVLVIIDLDQVVEKFVHRPY